MKSKKPIIFKIQQPIMCDNNFRQMLEGVMAHRDNLIRYGTPFPPEQPDIELVEKRKRQLDKQITDCKSKIKELEDAKERYGQLLRVIYEEECRIKDEQRSRSQNRELGEYPQRPM